jgi:pyruvate/2-oxoglutarate/acetoin dehydrogenase E1 component
MKYRDAVEKELSNLLSTGKVVLVNNGAKNPYVAGGLLYRLNKMYPESVIDYPPSEASMANFCVGLALRGITPILTFVRMDFGLWAIEGIVHGAVMLQDMLGKQGQIPFILYEFVNRGNQVGATHQGNYVSWFAHLPRAKVFAPSTPEEVVNSFELAYKLGGFSVIHEDTKVRDNEGEWPKQPATLEELKPKVVQTGDDVTVVAYGSGIKTAIEASKKYNVSAEVIGLSLLKPLDVSELIKSLEKTKRLVLVGQSWYYASIESEIIASIQINKPESLNYKVRRVTLEERTAPASAKLEAGWLAAIGVDAIGRELLACTS